MQVFNSNLIEIRHAKTSQTTLRQKLFTQFVAISLVCSLSHKICQFYGCPFSEFTFGVSREKTSLIHPYRESRDKCVSISSGREKRRKQTKEFQTSRFAWVETRVQFSPSWRRRWDSNSRAGFPTNAFRVRPGTTTSVRLHKNVICFLSIKGNFIFCCFAWFCICKTFMVSNNALKYNYCP